MHPAGLRLFSLLYLFFLANMTLVCGPASAALNFNNGNYVRIEDSPSLDITAQITLEAWVYKTWNGEDWNIIFSKPWDYDDNPWHVYRLGITDAEDVPKYATCSLALVGGVAGVGGTSVIPDNTWVHLACTYDGSEMKMYVNGNLEKTTPASGAINTNNQPVIIGRNFLNTWNDWFGYIDDVRIWNAARTPQEIRDSMNRRLNGTETGLAGYWKLDEWAGTAATDASENSNTGTLNGNPTWVIGGPLCSPTPAGLVSWWGGDNNALDIVGTNNGALQGNATYAAGKVGQAFSLDGGDDYVEMAGGVTSAAQFSFSFWMNINSFTHPWYMAPICQSQTQPGLIPGFCFASGNGVRDFGMFGVWTDGTLFDLRVPIPFGTGIWKHVSITYDGSWMRQYVDGVLLNEGSFSGKTLGNNQPFVIGQGKGYPGGNLETGYFHGLVDEVAFFNRPLLAEEIAAIYNAGSAGKCRPCAAPPSEMVSWWSGENSALDRAGTNDGALMNEATYGTGRVGQAFSLDGVDDYITVPNNPSLNPSTITVNAWILSNNSPGTYAPPIVQKSDYRGYTLELTADSSQVKFWVKLEKTNPDWTNWVGSPGGTLTPGTWTHVAGIYDGTAVSLYMNGQLIGSTPEVASIVHSESDLNIGRNSYETRPFFKGLIDEVGIFNRALSPEEIAAIYNAGSSGQCPIRRVLTVTPSGTGSGSVTGNFLNCSWNGGSSSGTCSVNLIHRTAVSLSATPSVGSTFNGWSGGSGSAKSCSGTGACAFSLTEASGVGSPFALNTYNLAVTPSGTGSGSVTGNGLNCSWNGSSSSGTCSVSLAYNTAVTLTATPNLGSTFSGWSGGGSAVSCSGTAPCSFSITQASGVGAPFVLNTYNLAVTPSGTGSGSVTGNGLNCSWNGSSSSGTCSVSLTYNTAVTLTATPNLGSSFSGWSGGGSAVSCSGTGACSFSITQASGVGAPFVLNTYTLTANALGNGAGTVQSNVGGVNYNYPAVNTGTTSALNHGTNAMLTATASTGSTVAWTTCAGTASANGTPSATCTYASLDGNKTAAAAFTLNTYNMTVIPSGAGSGTVTGNGLNCSWNGSSSSGTCSASLAHNTAVSLTASSGIGSAFSGWSGGSGSAEGCNGTGTCAFNMTEVSGIGSIFIQKSSIYLPLILRP